MACARAGPETHGRTAAAPKTSGKPPGSARPRACSSRTSARPGPRARSPNVRSPTSSVQRLRYAAAVRGRPENGSAHRRARPGRPLIRALLRVWAAAFLAAGWPHRDDRPRCGGGRRGLPPVAGRAAVRPAARIAPAATSSPSAAGRDRQRAPDGRRRPPRHATRRPVRRCAASTRCVAAASAVLALVAGVARPRRRGLACRRRRSSPSSPSSRWRGSPVGAADAESDPGRQHVRRARARARRRARRRWVDRCATCGSSRRQPGRPAATG